VRPFVTELDEFAVRYLKQTGDISFPGELHEDMKARFCEDLVFCSSLTLRTFGENAPLAMLCNWFGPGVVRDLLRDGVLEFVLWDVVVTQITNNIPGLLPLQSGTLTSPVHSDPEVSAVSGLQYLLSGIAAGDRRRLIKAVCDRTRCVSGSLVKESVEFAHVGYGDGLFEPVGLDGRKPLTELNHSEKQQLAKIAASCLNLGFLTENENDPHRQREMWQLLDQRLLMIPGRSEEITRAAAAILKLERFPSLYDLVRTGQLDACEIPRIRSSKDSRKFRRWLANASADGDSDAICQEYVREISAENRLTSHTWFRVVEVMGIGALSVAFGETDLSVLIGAAGLTALDHIIVDKLLSGWTPRRFIEEQIKTRVDRR
jgi:hypothetical protein